MADDQRRHGMWRLWRTTFGRLWPVGRRLSAKGVWAWWTARGVIPRWQLLGVYIAVVAAGMVGLARTGDVATSAKQAVAGVQESRIELCEEANQRHDRTLEQLNREIKALGPVRRRRAEANRSATVRLLEAIAPRRDCATELRP